MYPYLIENCHLHYFDDHGILITEYGNFILNDIELYMITKFDGQKSLEEIISNISIELKTNREDEIKDILMQFIDTKAIAIKIGEKQNRVDLHITGKKGIKIPMNLILNLTNKCNLKCIHCFKGCNNLNNQYLPLERIIDMLNFFKGNLTNIQLTGGEPMLHRDFNTILKYCIENFRTTITTTATLMNSNNIEIFSGISNVQISLYSYDSKKHDDVTLTPGSYEKTINGIIEAVKAKINVTIGTILTKENYNEVEEIIKLAINLGVPSIRFGILIPLGRGLAVNPDWELSEEDIKIITENLNAYSQKYQEKINIETWQEELQSKHLDKKYNCLDCGSGVLTWTICENGIVKPCEFLPDSLYPMGNIVETNVEEILNSYNFNDLPYCMHKWAKELEVQNICISSICPQMKNYLTNHSI